MSCAGYLYVWLMKLEMERDKLKRVKSGLEKEAWIRETVAKINKIMEPKQNGK